jgi:predicted N-acetyltransferase YhbS
MIHIAPEKPEDIGYINETNSQAFETDAEARLMDKLIGVIKPLLPLVAKEDGISGEVLYHPFFDEV